MRSSYKSAFGMTQKEAVAMPRKDFADKFGSKFLNMSPSKFNKELKRDARVYHPRTNNSYCPYKKPKDYRLSILSHMRSGISRCQSDPSYKRRNIQFLLSFDDICKLWIRDEADKMRKPSIDRIKGNKNYTFDNCQFIEWEENKARGRHSFRNKQDEVYAPEHCDGLEA